jgi:hypothetical protein
MRLLPEPVGDQQQHMSRAIELARSKNPKPVLANDLWRGITALEILNYPRRTFCDISFVAEPATRIPGLQKEDCRVIKPYLIISIAAAVMSKPVLAAEPFMDGAPGHCFLCELLAPNSVAKSQTDNCPKPNQISRSFSDQQREAKSDSRLAD